MWMNFFAALSLLALSCGFGSELAVAQKTVDYYTLTQSPRASVGVRVGGMYCFTRTVSVSTPPIAFIGYTDKVTGYIGGFYTRDILPNQIALRTDLGLQAKGAGAAYKSVTYYYLSAAVALGVHLMPKLSLYLGPEINLLTLKQNSWGKGAPVEFGATSRLVYQFGAVGLELGYFRSLSPYDRSDINATSLGSGPFSNDFYNQNVQLGCTYNFSK